MTQLPLEIYRIDMKYIRNLHNIDNRVFSVSPQIGKDERPFLGLITLIGVLNFNLMIPVENAQIQRIDTKIRKHDNMDTRRKKELLIKELEWYNRHVSDLTNTANVLYQKYVSGEKFTARKQCLDFKRMELECSKYNDKL